MQPRIDENKKPPKGGFLAKRDRYQRKRLSGTVLTTPGKLPT